MRRPKTLITALGAATALLVLGPQADAQLSISKSEIDRAARVQWMDTKRHTPLEPNPAVVAYVQCIADSIIAQLDPDVPELDWEVLVFDNPSINASADPTGKIAVLNGILRVADNPDALAVVLGHEIAHATEGHVYSRAKRGTGFNLLARTLGGAAGVDPDLAGTGAELALNLPYARDQESEADAVGMQYMARAGYDPRAAIAFWKQMIASKEGQERPAQLTSSHPADDLRIDEIIKGITPALIAYNEARANGIRPTCALR